ncbi:helix-turn-helix domain-containing protein [Candidatus Fermentibacteria bacterium]|nr:helix-turn-helix domain-containing protein [Candidatus Fermentibacteria bacterium]
MILQEGHGLNEIMTIEEVASYLRLKPQTIYKWAQEKRIPAAKLGKEWRFRRSVIDLWLDEQMFGQDSQFTHLREKRTAPLRPEGRS